MPVAEVEAHAAAFSAYGIDVWSLFAPPSPGRRGYLSFPTDQVPVQLATSIPAMTTAKRAELLAEFDQWWDGHVKLITELPRHGHTHVMLARRDLLTSFRDTCSSSAPSTAISWPAWRRPGGARASTTS